MAGCGHRAGNDLGLKLGPVLMSERFGSYATIYDTDEEGFSAGDPTRYMCYT